MKSSAATLVWNPAAGRKRSHKAVGLVAAELTAGGFDVELVQPEGIEAMRAALAAAAEAERLPVVAGGDGSIHQAVNALAGTGTTVGIVAAGTGNDFASALGLPTVAAGRSLKRFAQAAAAAVAGEPVACDAIEVREPDGTHRCWAASHVTCGFPVEVNDRAKRVSFPPGGAKYTVATIYMSRRSTVRRYQMLIDDQPHALDAFMLVVANSRSFGGGVKIAPQADPCDGVLNVMSASGLSPGQLLRLLPKTRAGKHTGHPAVTMLTGAKLKLAVGASDTSSATDVPLEGDGEPVGSLPCAVEVVPGSLKIAGANPLPPMAK